MIKNQSLGLILVLIVFGALVPSRVNADNGTIVSGTVTAIDGFNSIIRVHVTGVNGQFLPGSPLVNYVDYLVTGTSQVFNSGGQPVNQGYLQVGSQVRLVFVGPVATAIHVTSQFQQLQGGGVTTYYPGRSFTSTQFQSYLPVQNYVSHQTVTQFQSSIPIQHHNTNQYQLGTSSHHHLQNSDFTTSHTTHEHHSHMNPLAHHPSNAQGSGAHHR